MHLLHLLLNLCIHRPTKLLNYITAPDTVIWSALLASAAVPGILNPVVLMQKLKDGRTVPWNWGSKFKDGSLRYVEFHSRALQNTHAGSSVDIPVQGLNLYFNGQLTAWRRFITEKLT